MKINKDRKCARMPKSKTQDPVCPRYRVLLNSVLFNILLSSFRPNLEF